MGYARRACRKRQIDGIAAVKRDGKYLGQSPNAMIQAERIVSLRQSGLGINAIADRLGVQSHVCLPCAAAERPGRR